LTNALPAGGREKTPASEGGRYNGELDGVPWIKSEVRITQIIDQCMAGGLAAKRRPPQKAAATTTKRRIGAECRG
jgi:hypothetical protein